MSEQWISANAEGLAFAAEGNWHSAAQAFLDSLDALERLLNAGGITRAAYDDARARLLLNVGQSYFHVNNWADAQRYAERSCAIRVGLYGEDSLVVARTRGDLAVIVGAAGHHDESISLLERAVSAVERKGGAQSAHLIPLLGNAAKLLARRAPTLATPYINRLDAVQSALRARELNTHIAPSAIPEHTFEGGPSSVSSDDHLLRSAIAQTVDLLRTTPVANMAVPPDSAARSRDELSWSDAVMPDAVLPEASLPDSSFPDIVPPEALLSAPAWSNAKLQEASLRERSFPDIVPPETLLSDTSLDEAVFDLVAPPPPTLSVVPARDAGAGAVSPLGFDVQYGIPPQLHEPLDTTDTVPLDMRLGMPTDEPVAVTTPDVRLAARKFGGSRRGSTQVASSNNVLYIAAVLALVAGAAVYMFVAR